MLNDEQIIDRVYEAALLPERWTSVLVDLSAISDAAGTILFAANERSTIGISTPGVESILEAAQSPYWAPRNTRGQLLLTLPQAEFHSDADHFTRDEMSADPLYTDLHWKLGLGYAAATWIAPPNGDNLIISIERRRERGPFEREVVNRLTGLRPHIARSALLAARMDFERIRSANLAFETSGLPSAAVASDGTVVDANPRFERMTAQARIGALDRLLLSSKHAQNFLQQSLSMLQMRDPDFVAAARSLPLPAAGDNPAAVIHLVPVRRLARDLFSRATLFVIITALGDKKLPSAHVIQGLFDLTVSETRVAMALAENLTVDEASRKLGISRETVRHHLKSIFVKTGLSRQSELVSRIGGLPNFE